MYELRVQLDALLDGHLGEEAAVLLRLHKLLHIRLPLALEEVAEFVAQVTIERHVIVEVAQRVKEALQLRVVTELLEDSADFLDRVQQRAVHHGEHEVAAEDDNGAHEPLKRRRRIVVAEADRGQGRDGPVAGDEDLAQVALLSVVGIFDGSAELVALHLVETRVIDSHDHILQDLSDPVPCEANIVREQDEDDGELADAARI